MAPVVFIPNLFAQCSSQLYECNLFRPEAVELAHKTQRNVLADRRCGLEMVCTIHPNQIQLVAVS